MMLLMLFARQTQHIANTREALPSQLGRLDIRSFNRLRRLYTLEILRLVPTAAQVIYDRLRTFLPCHKPRLGPLPLLPLGYS
jgi:hypothetical protein